MTDSYFNKAGELLKSETPFATAIVVRAEKPTSSKPGDKAIITKDGGFFGWIGGSCAQPLVVEQAVKALSEGKARFIRLSKNPEKNIPREGLIDLPLTCFSGGTLEIYIEPQLPVPRLLIVGNLPVAHALAQLGKVMDYHIIMVDPDANEITTTLADELVTDISGIQSKITPLTYVVVASHGNYDELALDQALPSSAAYISLVASSTRAAAVIEYLKAAGHSDEEIARLKYPAGLDIQALQGKEIAVSIMAEIVQVRRNITEIDIDILSEIQAAQENIGFSIDPICGMTVAIHGAEHVLDHEGTSYYFCCVNCKTMFSEIPEKYLEQPLPQGDAIDPVCGMTVAISSAKYMSEHDGDLHYFCAAGCKMEFDNQPSKYLEAAKADNR